MVLLKDRVGTLGQSQQFVLSIVEAIGAATSSQGMLKEIAGWLPKGGSNHICITLCADVCKVIGRIRLFPNTCMLLD